MQVFWDSDIGKWIEAAAYALSHRRDPDIEAKIETIVDDFEKAQAPDGYTADGIAVHLYGGISTTLATAGTKVAVRETSHYPWSGDIKIEIDPQTPATFDVKLRIPGWCHGAKVAVNGAAVPVEGRTVNGYLTINRTWIKGDVVTLDLPMPPVRLYAHPGVIMDAGLVALKRGPLVYCVEEADNPGGRVRPSSCRASRSCRCRPVPICSTAS